MKEFVKKIIGIEEIKNHKFYFFMKVLLVTIFAITIFLNSIFVFSGKIGDTVQNIYFSEVKIQNIILLIGTWIVTYFGVSIIEMFLPKMEETILVKKERKTKSTKVFFIVFFILVLAWLPYALSYFPGGIYSDTTHTINQALGNAPFNNHNPILYAWIMRVFINIGTKIQGLQLGIELFTIFQIFIMAVTFSGFVNWLYQKKVSTKYLVVVTLFFAFCRLIPLYAISLWKDTPFCIALFWYIWFIAETIYQDGKNLEKLRYVIGYVVLLLLVAFLRNNGIYIVTCTSLLLLWMYRKNILLTLKKFTFASIVAIMITFIIQGPVYNHLGISTEFVENLGVPVQQICYVVAKDGNLTEEQKDFINQLCPIEVIKENYAPCLVDTIKWNKDFSDEFLEENKGEFFRVWFQIFLQNPISYIKAYLINTIGFWDVGQATMDAYINPEMWHDTDECMGVKQIDYVQKITSQSIRGVLKPTVAVSSAIYLWIMLLSALIIIYKKQYKKLLIHLPGFLTWATIMIAVPLAFSLRYVYILLLMVPLSCIIPFWENKKEERTKLENESV